MAAIERITVTLPRDLVQEVDRAERNRSRFVLQAVKRELERRRRAELLKSIRRPHSESRPLANADLQAWAASLPEDVAEDLVDTSSGTPVRWIEGRGWIEDDE